VPERKPHNSHFRPEYWQYLFGRQITSIPLLMG